MLLEIINLSFLVDFSTPSHNNLKAIDLLKGVGY